MIFKGSLTGSVDQLNILYLYIEGERGGGGERSIVHWSVPLFCVSTTCTMK